MLHVSAGQLFLVTKNNAFFLKKKFQYCLFGIAEYIVVTKKMLLVAEMSEFWKLNANII